MEEALCTASLFINFCSKDTGHCSLMRSIFKFPVLKLKLKRKEKKSKERIKMYLHYLRAKGSRATYHLDKTPFISESSAVSLCNPVLTAFEDSRIANKDSRHSITFRRPAELLHNERSLTTDTKTHS